MIPRTTIVLIAADAAVLAATTTPVTLHLRTAADEGGALTAIGHLSTTLNCTSITIGPSDADVTVDWSAGRVAGGIPQPDGSVRPIDLLRVVGDRITLLLAGDGDDVAEIFDRQVRALSDEGQRVLRQLHVGVVGAGGTGSAVCEQLIRLGVGHLTVIDHDVITDTNVTRVWGSTIDDVGTPKVAIVTRSAAAIGLGTTVTPVHDSIANEQAAKALRHCDVILGCTDDNVGRLVLCRLAYVYVIPVIDMGVQIDTHDDGRVTAIDGRVTYMVPGLPCLDCRGWIDHERLDAEEIPDDELAELEADGYVVGLDNPDPSVIPYTTAVAAQAIADLLARLFGLSQVPADQILQFHAHQVRTPGRASHPDHFCVDPHLIGAGDLEPFLDRPWTS